MLKTFFHWLTRLFSDSAPLDDSAWNEAMQRVRGTRNLTDTERHRLRGVVRDFMHEKRFIAADGFELTEPKKLMIAIQACIPILHLGLDAYRRFQSIYVFPRAFQERGKREWRPGHNVVGSYAGVAVQGGGIGLAWSESSAGFADEDDGYNPIIHEFAHQLDMIDGAADGRPELPPGITQKEWFQTFSTAFADFQDRIAGGRRTRLSDYAATNPAEFFAVLSEVYFEVPENLEKEYPDVLRLLRAFYSQQPPAS